jgi:hypothetical protein
MSVTYSKREPNKPKRVFRSLIKEEIEEEVKEQPKKRGRPSTKNL